MADGDDFTFAVVPPPLAAGAGGGVFSGGRVVGGPVYPVFGRPRLPPRAPEPEPQTATVRVPLGQLLLVDREPSSPALLPARGEDEFASVPEDTYCPWSPGWSAAASPARCRKSGSTGSVLRWRPRLVARSQSDGKEKFVFLSTASASGSSGRKGRTGDGGDHAWSYYAKGAAAGGSGGGRRQTFLPYKQDLVGLFANAAVYRWSYHNPF